MSKSNEIASERPSPAEQRKSLELANNFVKYGIRFVPMPVLNDVDQQNLVKQAQERLDYLASNKD